MAQKVIIRLHVMHNLIDFFPSSYFCLLLKETKQFIMQPSKDNQHISK